MIIKIKKFYRFINYIQILMNFIRLLNKEKENGFISIRFQIIQMNILKEIKIQLINNNKIKNKSNIIYLLVLLEIKLFQIIFFLKKFHFYLHKKQEHQVDVYLEKEIVQVLIIQ